jgi:hypothetical protein
MNYIHNLDIAELVPIQTVSGAIAVAGTDVKPYDGKAKIVVRVLGDASVKATLQHNDVAAYDDGNWAAVEDLDGEEIAYEPGTANASVVTWTVAIQDLNRYVRVLFANAVTAHAEMIAGKKSP